VHVEVADRDGEGDVPEELSTAGRPAARRYPHKTDLAADLLILLPTPRAWFMRR